MTEERFKDGTLSGEGSSQDGRRHTPAVLDLLLRAEAADGMPEGARFETFASPDRMLGLELIREIGRVPLPEAG
ncbi:hypothetical protein [Streptomyces sp. NPDC048473]|uniref:hypothetical protein n=1 Tax=unclassified Streptomyces TaxID=2593676 RepID=UPI0037246058